MERRTKVTVMNAFYLTILAMILNSDGFVCKFRDGKFLFDNDIEAPNWNRVQYTCSSIRNNSDRMMFMFLRYFHSIIRVRNELTRFLAKVPRNRHIVCRIIWKKKNHKTTIPIIIKDHQGVSIRYHVNVHTVIPYHCHH